MTVLTVLEAAGAALWSAALPILLCAAHLFLTIRLGVPQRRIGQGIRDSVRAADGERRSFSALAVQLSATLGVGNITGVALAVIGGGAGAVFWVWIAGLFGIATTYAEARMTLECRKAPGEGGPWDAMGPRLGSVYAFCVALGGLFLGSMIPANAAALALPVPRPASAAVLTVLTGCVILGGADWIRRACERLLPLAAALYLACCCAILSVCRAELLPALRAIFSGAFRFRSAACGLLGGICAASPGLRAVRYGVSRGLFSNEAGLGTAGIAAAALPDGDPSRQAMVSATATFWDTVVFCGITGVAFTAAALHAGIDTADGAAFCLQAFSLLPLGRTAFRVCTVLLGYACILGWGYVGARAFSRACPGVPEKVYAVFWTAAAGAGALCSAAAVWSVSDLLNAAAAVPILYILWKYYGFIHT